VAIQRASTYLGAMSDHGDPAAPLAPAAPATAPLAFPQLASPSALQPGPLAAPLAPSPAERPGLLRGLRLFFGGFASIARQPRAWPLALVPVAAASVLTLLLGGLSVGFVPDLVARFAPTATGFWLGLAQVAATVVAVVASVFLSLALAQPVSGPALEALVRTVERELGAPERANTPFLLDVARSLGSATLGFAVGAPIFALLFLLSFVPGAAFVTVPLKFVVAATIVGWDVLDYPLSVRGVGLGERLRFVARNLPAVFGLAVGVAAVALLPCGLLLVLPAGVAGATRLVHEIHAYERRGSASRAT
jgi:CysZ protein